ncbi:hypothetical protein CXG81DRAFT_11876 [Caulochytrium protostelioides]|uniref:Uncharacterized protein n=1 Tax=Caulochytrium protostelioides TaxID=1555241 RepID=A0A4P9WYF7_9FUNG|nr:hypothetical protein CAUPRSCDRAFT_6583 [Caulochytrium protostelioides]RKP01514.1 hypothetical protein CXG81DRAFT_11876 [Caulochytrium protostelioides]|eukprot:RKP01514.1 hypothetical protein CXG81DRAFT_11876 [Caulochytrium protostelioides]
MPLSPRFYTPSAAEHAATAPGSMPDPMNLRSRIMPDDELEALRRQGAKSRKLVKYYETQNELIRTLLTPVHYVDEDVTARLGMVRGAMYASVVANIVLFMLQLWVAVSSGSLSLFATMADAFMDLASNTVLLVAGHAATRESPFKYPVGKTRLETAGIIVFASLMATLSFQLIIESGRTLLGQQHTVVISFANLLCIGFAILLKAALFVYCHYLRMFPSTSILAIDHRNDVILNLTAVFFSLLGQHVNPLVDPVGGIVIAMLIMHSWVGVAMEQIKLIVGRSADAAFLQRITYITCVHDDRVLKVDTCRAYTMGSNFFVEVDIVLEPQMSLLEAHDVGEALQMKLEELPMVDRAFVHLDYESTHPPEHRKMGM